MILCVNVSELEKQLVYKMCEKKTNMIQSELICEPAFLEHLSVWSRKWYAVNLNNAHTHTFLFLNQGV